MSATMQRHDGSVRIDAASENGAPEAASDVKAIAEANYRVRTQLADDSRYDWVQAETQAALQSLAIALAGDRNSGAVSARLAELRRVAQQHDDSSLSDAVRAIEGRLSGGKRSFFSRLLAT